MSSHGLEGLRAIEGFASASKYQLRADSYWFVPMGRQQTYCFQGFRATLMEVGADK